MRTTHGVNHNNACGTTNNDATPKTINFLDKKLNNVYMEKSYCSVEQVKESILKELEMP